MQEKQVTKKSIPAWLEGLPKSWDSNISVLYKNGKSSLQTKECPSGFIYIDLERNQIQLHRTSKSPRKEAEYFIHEIGLINMKGIVYICVKDCQTGKTNYFMPKKTARRV